MRSAVLAQLNAPLELRTCIPSELRYGQVRVQILLTGICGAQLQEIRGEKAAEYIPHMLGHEACARVLEIGEGVRTVKVGDKVCCHWRKGEGADVSGGSYYCESGGVTSGPIHTFCEEAVLSENRVTAVPEDAPDELVALLGCALSTALGVCENEARLKMGESVLVVGCGGVGLSVIRAARCMGAREIGAVDHDDKSDLAISAGADFFTNSLHGSPGGKWDCIINTIGTATLSDLLSKRGRYILIGQPDPRSDLVLRNPAHLFEGDGKRFVTTQGGGFNPSKDIPRYIRAWRSGVLKYDGIVTHTFAISDINQAIETLKSGTAGRVMLKP